MIPPETITRALAMEPDRPGVARLCQELLAECTGQPMPGHEAAPLMRLAGTRQVGNRNRSRRPGVVS